METHTGNLGAYVAARRDALGLKLTALALRAQLSKSELSGLEHGKIKLPGADKRRRLAEALRLSHAELLVASGEVTAEEIVEGANVYDPDRRQVAASATAQLFPENSPAAKIVEILRTLSDEDAALVLGTARMLDRRARGVIDEDDRNTVVTVNSARRFGS